MDLGLKGKVAIITGASCGLGLAICHVLAKEGVHIAFGYRKSTPEKEQLVKKNISEIKNKYGVDVYGACGDISVKENIDHVIDDTIHHF